MPLNRQSTLEEEEEVYVVFWLTVGANRQRSSVQFRHMEHVTLCCKVVVVTDVVLKYFLQYRTTFGANCKVSADIKRVDTRGDL